MSHSAADIEVAANLRTAVSRLVKVLRKQTRGDSMLSLTERSTLSAVNMQKNILPSELAALEKVTTQSMSQIISRLGKAGYIKRTFSKEDKRKVLITITAAGKKLIDTRITEKNEWLVKTINEKITAKEKEALKNAIEILAKLAE